jgi:2-oxoglutarate dehydrogenase E2 component (dihydrolipoamide succinyltransferase)
MPIELKIPAVGESITEVQIGKWLKGEGQSVNKDEPLVEIETDKATVELPAPIAGSITQVLKRTGDTAAVGETIGYMEPGEARGDKATGDDQATAQAHAAQAFRTPSKPQLQAVRTAPPRKAIDSPAPESSPAAASPKPEPAGLKPTAPKVAADKPRSLIAPESRRTIRRARDAQRAQPAAPALTGDGDRQEEVVPMTPIRRRIAQRLVEAQQTAALLTTFNEIDMSAVIELRNEHKQVFLERYGVKLGFMSFFVKAAIDALKLVPEVNSEVRGNDIVYHNYFDIGIAVGGGKGLVVPVLRDADRMSFAEIEIMIADLAHRARENSLQLDELRGGTFTISNGGVYGSMLSTPIVNPPQSGILGLHAIQDRPVAREGHVVIRPMMYVALTYDHRVVDGQGAVTFLKRVKDVIEEPMRMLVEI